MTPTILELFAALWLAFLQGLLAYVVAPPRILALAKLVRVEPKRSAKMLEADGVEMIDYSASKAHSILVVTVQSFQDVAIREPFSLSVRAIAPGSFITPETACFVGIDEHFLAMNATDQDCLGQAASRRIDVTIQEMRAFKTYTFYFYCAHDTYEAVVSLEGSSRSAAELVPALGVFSAISALQKPLGKFVATRRICLESEASGLSVRRNWGTKVWSGDARVLAVSVLLVLATYLSASLFRLDIRTLAEAAAAIDLATDLPAIACLAVLTVIIFFLVRPVPGIIAQGYLEKRKLHVVPSAPKP